MFRFNHHHQGARYLSFAKATLLFQTVSQTYTNQDLIIYAATPPN